LVLLRRAHLAGLERVEQRRDHGLRLRRQLLGGQREQALDLLLELFGRELQRHSDTPAMRSAALIRVSCLASIGTSGRRNTLRHLPIIARPAFIGIGLLSMNAASTSGARR